MNLILVSKEEISSDGTVNINDSYRLKSINSILKSGSASSLKTGIIGGKLGYAEVADINYSDGLIESVVLDTSSLDMPPPEPLDLILICAMQRPKTLKKILQTVTALGVKKIYIIETWKVEKSYWTSSLLNEEELRAQLLLGLEQCVDTILPEVCIKRAFRPFAEDELPGIASGRLSFVAHPYTESCELSLPVAGPVTLAVGPEGGFTDYEVKKFNDTGFIPVSLGDRILRSEYAVTALIALLKSSL